MGPDVYLERVGRSGRIWRRGTSVCFLTTEDVAEFRRIQQDYNTVIEEMPMDINDFLRYG